MNRHFDQQDKKSDELMERMKETNQRLAGLEHEARQQCLAMEADATPGTKARKRTEDAVADRAKHGDINSSARVDHDPMCLTSFSGNSTEPTILPCRYDAVVDKGTEAPKPCLSPFEIRTLTAAGGLLPARTASTAMRAIFPRPLFSLSLGEETEKRTSRTNFNQLAPRCWRKVIPTKSRQTLVFDPGHRLGHLRGCQFLKGRYALRSGWVHLVTAMVAEAGSFLVHGRLGHHFQEKAKRFVMPYVLQLIAIPPI